MLRRFLGTPEKYVAAALKRSTFQYMKDHSTQFDDNWVRDKLAKQMGLSGRPMLVGKVNKGQVGSGRKGEFAPWIEVRAGGGCQQVCARVHLFFGWSFWVAPSKTLPRPPSNSIDSPKTNG